MRKKRRSRAFREQSQVIDIDKVRNERKQKRRLIGESKTPKKEAPDVSARRAAKVMKKRLFYGCGLLALLVIFCLTAYNLVSLKWTEKDEAKRLSDLKDEKTRLEQELEQVDSEEYVEKEARGQLHMVKPGEVLYVLPETEGKASGAAVTGKAITKENE